MAVPLFDTATPLAPLRAEILDRIGEVVASGAFILGPAVAAFEAEFAAYLGVRHVVGVANGTDALTLALLSLQLPPGTEVIVPAFTYVATLEAAALLGLRPVLVEVRSDTCNVDPAAVRAALGPRTGAVVAVGANGFTVTGVAGRTSAVAEPASGLPEIR